MATAAIIKCVGIIMFLGIAIMNVGAIVTYWRNVHSKWEEVILSKFPHDTELELRSVNAKLPDIVFMKLGIIKNCKVNAGECDVELYNPDKEGFIGDSTILVLLSISIILYVLNILVIILSGCLDAFPQRALYILPLTCFIATVFMGIAIVIATIYRNIWYIRLDGKTFESDADYKVKDDYLIGPYFYKITFAEGYYGTIAAAVLSMLVSCVAGCVAYVSVDDDEKQQNQTEDIYVVKVGQPAELLQPPPQASSAAPPAVSQRHQYQQRQQQRVQIRQEYPPERAYTLSYSESA